MLTDAELIRIDERLCTHGFAPAIDPGGHVNNAPPFDYVAKNGTRFLVSTRGSEARLYSKHHPDGVGEIALDDLEIVALVGRAIAEAKG